MNMKKQSIGAARRIIKDKLSGREFVAVSVLVELLAVIEKQDKQLKALREKASAA